MSESTDELSNAEAKEAEAQAPNVSDENATTGIDQELIQSIPVTVTVCIVSQFADVNVMRLVTVASPVSEDVIVRATSEDG